MTVICGYRYCFHRYVNLLHRRSHHVSHHRQMSYFR
jgi:hypothetical protein